MIHTRPRCQSCRLPPLLQLRLNPQQLEEKRAHEAAVKEIEDEISLEDDNSKREVLSTELAARQQKLDALMERFEVGQQGGAGFKLVTPVVLRHFRDALEALGCIVWQPEDMGVCLLPVLDVLVGGE